MLPLAFEDATGDHCTTGPAAAIRPVARHDIRSRQSSYAPRTPEGSVEGLLREVLPEGCTPDAYSGVREDFEAKTVDSAR